jgi:hypothetical protein
MERMEWHCVQKTGVETVDALNCGTVDDYGVGKLQRAKHETHRGYGMHMTSFSTTLTWD